MLLVAFLGCFVPVLPGPTLAYAALLLRHFCSERCDPYTPALLLLMGAAMVAVLLLDYLIPGWIMRKAGGSKYAARGALIGMIAGIFFTPIGMLLGMLLGALIGELMNSSDLGRAVSVAAWSFLGFLLSVGIKCVYCIVAARYFFN